MIATSLDLSARHQARPVHAVVVTYRCEDAVKPTLEALLHEVDTITVIDNVSGDGTAGFVASFAGEHPERVQLIENTANNLAAAQNLGITRALGLGFDWVLLMDHDSVPERGMVQAMLQALDRYATPATIGMIVPNLSDRGSRREIRYLRRSRFLFRRTGFGTKAVLDDVLIAIASGSLIRRELFGRIGLMNESFGIDDVDRDFALRCVGAGYRILAVKNARLRHRIGESRDHALGPIRLSATHHPASRRHSIYRNRVACWRMHGRRFPGFVLFDFCAIILDHLRIILVENDKAAKLLAAWTGLREGVNMKLGGARHLTAATP